ncbi:MAG: hypothetical protein ACFFDD_15275 [Promethearchaeota archaeon]
MNSQSSVIRLAVLGFVLIGMIIAISGLVLDAYWTQQFWANKPPYSTGPILVGTAGLFVMFPSGVLISLSGVVVLLYDRFWISKRDRGTIDPMV